MSACEAWREMTTSGERPAGASRPDAAPCPACCGGDGRWASTLMFAAACPPDEAPSDASGPSADCSRCGGSGLAYLAEAPPDGPGRPGSAHPGDPSGVMPEAVDACAEVIRLWSLAGEHGLAAACTLLGFALEDIHPGGAEALARLSGMVLACRGDRMTRRTAAANGRARAHGRS